MIREAISSLVARLIAALLMLVIVHTQGGSVAISKEVFLTGPREHITPQAGQAQAARAKALDEEKSVAGFIERVKQYVKMREKLEGELPKLSTEASPAEIEKHQKALRAKLLAARADAKHGDIFTPDTTKVFRRMVKEDFKGQDRQELKKIILGADTKGVPPKVNASYPDTKEFGDVPPTLLQTLPQLPKQLRYRFAGRHMLLVDREADLILDYSLNVIPQ